MLAGMLARNSRRRSKRRVIWTGHHLTCSDWICWPAMMMMTSVLLLLFLIPFFFSISRHVPVHGWAELCSLWILHVVRWVLTGLCTISIPWFQHCAMAESSIHSQQLQLQCRPMLSSKIVMPPDKYQSEGAVSIQNACVRTTCGLSRPESRAEQRGAAQSSAEPLQPPRACSFGARAGGCADGRFATD